MERSGFETDLEYISLLPVSESEVSLFALRISMIRFAFVRRTGIKFYLKNSLYTIKLYNRHVRIGFDVSTCPTIYLCAEIYVVVLL